MKRGQYREKRGSKSQEITIKWERERYREGQRNIHLGSLAPKVFETQNLNTNINIIFPPLYGLSWVSIIYNWQLKMSYPIKKTSMSYPIKTYKF